MEIGKPWNGMNELTKLFNESGMGIADFAYALGIRKQSFTRMMDGIIPTPEGVIADSHQILADIDYVRSIPNIENISYKVFKLVLDGTE
jgi:hypothetical protein